MVFDRAKTSKNDKMAQLIEDSEKFPVSYFFSRRFGMKYGDEILFWVPKG